MSIRHRKRTVGLREDVSRGRAKDSFVAILGEDQVAERQRQIDALPTVQWQGRTLYTIRCSGDFGNGPHVVNVPESLLWALMSLEQYRCPYH